jgi:hypothetical protein
LHLHILFKMTFHPKECLNLLSCAGSTESIKTGIPDSIVNTAL